MKNYTTQELREALSKMQTEVWNMHTFLYKNGDNDLEMSAISVLAESVYNMIQVIRAREI